MLRSTARQWGSVARLFHWAGAAFIVYLLADGWWMTHMAERAGRLPMYRSHAVLGYNVLLLFVLRIAWRGIDRMAPGMPQGSNPWEWQLAHATHGLLYLLVIAVSFTGWLLAGTFREPLGARCSA